MPPYYLYDTCTIHYIYSKQLLEPQTNVAISLHNSKDHESKNKKTTLRWSEVLIVSTC